jgi:tetratricopeptide (TPR) repeat protein
VNERYDRLADPATPVAEAAALITEAYDGTPVFSLLADSLLARGASPERLNEIGEALLAASGAAPSLTALTFAALAARAAGDAAAARRLLDQALAVAADPETGDPDTLSELAKYLSDSGRDGEAVELLEARLRERPNDLGAAERYGVFIELLYERVNGEAPGECQCGLGRPWADCCGPRERAALDRFTNRKGLNDFLAAVRAYAAEAGFVAAIQDEVAAALEATDDLEWTPAQRDQLAGLAEEIAQLGGGSVGEDDGDTGSGRAASPDAAGGGATPAGDDAEDEADRGVITAFGSDPSVPAELSARAVAWSEHIHYGLWQVREPGPAPGLWCMDISSSVPRYAEFPAEIADGTPRWAVWLGALVPFDGIWRCTGHGLWLSPDEADAAAELVQDGFVAIAAELTGKRARSSRLVNGRLRFGRAEPFGVDAIREDPAPDYAISLLSKVTGAMLQSVVLEVHAHRAAPPGLVNSDGDQMCLITARITISDGEQAADRLARRTDFERDPGEPGQVVWLGRTVPEAQRDAMLAEVTAQLQSRGLPAPELDETGRPQRWIRGQLKIRRNQIVAEVNSPQRLARLLDILARAGLSPEVTDETRVDPAQDIAWPAGPRALPGGAAPASEGWEKHWLDEKVPALRGRTPRQAAHGKERPRLETLLRQAEYEADLLAAQGKSGIDTAWLRHELSMDDDL